MLVNRTPHPVTIVDDDNNIIRVIEVSGLPPIRLKSSIVSTGDVDGVKLSKTVFGQAENLPEKEDGVYHIVSQLVKNACPNRDDLLVPAEVVRDENGNIIGCRSLGV